MYRARKNSKITSFMLVFVMALASLTPFALAATTETQFADGNTEFTTSFNAQGTTATSGVNIPYGAEVTSASFTVTGSPSASGIAWANASTNQDFGGPATTDGSMNIPYFSSEYRTSIDVSNNQAHLRTRMSEASWGLGRSSDVSSLGGASLNTTGQFVGNADSDMIGSSKTGFTTLSSQGSWNYPGPFTTAGSTMYVAQWSTSSVYNAPAIYRYNASTGATIGITSLTYNSCTTSSTRYLSDITADTSGSNTTIWMATWNYNYLSKWTINNSTLSCQQSWYVSSHNVGGVSFDPVDNEMYLVVSRYNSGNYDYYLWNVNRSNPTQALSNWFLTSYRSGSGQPSGLDVAGDRVTVNIYCTYATSTNCKARSWHAIFLKSGAWPEHQGDILFPNKAHYGIEPIGDGEIGFTCFFNTYCPSGNTWKIYTNGRSTAFNIDTPTVQNSIVTSSSATATRATDEVILSSAISWKPTNTSIDYQVTNDGGQTWKSANVGSSVIFSNTGTQLGWRAYLNGTSAEAPILDTIVLSYAGSYQQSGYMRMYNYYSGTNTAPVAAKLWWNATVNGGSSMTISWFNGYTSNCASSTTVINTQGQTVTFPGTYTGYLTFCIKMNAGGTGNSYTPILDDFNLSVFTDAPRNIELEIGEDGNRTTAWTYQDTLLGTTTASGGNLVQALNVAIPGEGIGIKLIPINVKSASKGTVSIDYFSITYTMQTVNLNITWDEEMVLHEKLDTFEVVTRHVIGEGANEISSAQLDFIATPNGDSPSMTWSSDGTLTDDDPEDWITPDASATWTNVSNGIMELHWAFRVTSKFPEQNNVGFRVSCTDNLGHTPFQLTTGPAGIRVNHSYGLGWLKVRDAAGAIHHEDVENDMWVKAGETLHFQGQVFYDGTLDSPLDGTYDVAVVKKTADGDFNQGKDRSNPFGEFFVPVTMDSIDRPDGVLYEVQIDNPRDPLKVLSTNSSWQRRIRVDATPPNLIEAAPADGSYEAGAYDQLVRIRVIDDVGSPEHLTLHYWIEADHDANRNGYADASEYVNHTMTNLSTDADKLFFATIDDSRNPNMARVSYYVTGTDPAGNALTRTDGPGFEYDLVTYRTRKDMDSVFTGLHWAGHSDGERAFAGTTQYMTLGLVDANGLIDFRDISLIFDFEGPDPVRDQQRLSFSGQNETFWTDDQYLVIPAACNDDEDATCGATVTTNETGLPWVMIDFAFQFSWNWPDADLSDVALEFTQLVSDEPRKIIFTEHTFRVENDLVLAADTYTVEDVQEPRLGPVFDGSRVVPDDRLRWSGHVLYEGSDVPAPRNLGITVEVFDGVQYWSDGSLTEEGGFSIEVPLGAASSLASSQTRTFLSGIRNIPGRGEDMTRDTVSTTLQVEVDHAPPRVLERLAPINVIDISNQTELTQIPVEFVGSEDSDLSGSPQWVHWLMRDENQRQIASGSSLLGMKQEGHQINWSGTVDLIGNGMNPPLQDYELGFWIEGWDTAGNPLATEGNSKSDPIREPVDLDNDNELQWIKFGALGAQLTIEKISADKERIATGEEITVTAWIQNLGGETSREFSVAFYSGDSEEPFATQKINGIADESIPVSTEWKAEKGIDRVVVVVDSNDEIVEVDEMDNSASVGVSVEYAFGLGWVENARQNMLAVIGIILAMIILPIVAFVSMRGAFTGSSELYEEDAFFEDEYEDEEYDDEYDDDEDEY